MVENARTMARPAPTDADELDRRNEAFWDELCGTALARQLGLVGRDRETLDAFDRAYFAFYPYLRRYLDRFRLKGREVLEVGLGYGTLGQEIVQRGARYRGLDIAPGPVRMMRHRLGMLEIAGDDLVVQGSAVDLPFPDASFDFVYSIGCLHHTGNLPGSIDEVRRVLRPGGHAVVMLYHADSLRQLLRVRLPTALARLRGRAGPTRSEVARMYDSDTSGTPAPHTDFVSRAMVRRYFRRYAAVRIETRNFDDLRLLGRTVIPRRRLLGSLLERRFGLDLYVIARR
jgi:SAM-dependent methyltransferase